MMKECLPVNLKINEEALKWYKNELDLKEGDQVRFFVRYGGCEECSKRLLPWGLKR